MHQPFNVCPMEERLGAYFYRKTRNTVRHLLVAVCLTFVKYSADYISGVSFSIAQNKVHQQEYYKKGIKSLDCFCKRSCKCQSTRRKKVSHSAWIHKFKQGFGNDFVGYKESLPDISYSPIQHVPRKKYYILIGTRMTHSNFESLRRIEIRWSLFRTSDYASYPINNTGT